MDSKGIEPSDRPCLGSQRGGPEDGIGLGGRGSDGGAITPSAGPQLCVLSVGGCPHLPPAPPPSVSPVGVAEAPARRAGRSRRPGLSPALLPGPWAAGTSVVSTSPRSRNARSSGTLALLCYSLFSQSFVLLRGLEQMSCCHPRPPAREGGLGVGCAWSHRRPMEPGAHLAWPCPRFTEEAAGGPGWEGCPPLPVPWQPALCLCFPGEGRRWKGPVLALTL